MMERVVQINDLSDPKGGASKLEVQAACDLAGRGHRVTFITGDAGNSPLLENAGVEIVALGQTRLLAGNRAKAMVTGLWNHAAYALVRDWIARNDAPGTCHHLHGWAEILSPAIFSAMDPVRERLVLSAHDFFLACPNGAFAWLKSGGVCPHDPLYRACLTTACDRDGAARKVWRSARQVVRRRAYRPRSSPPVLAIHAGMRSFLERAGTSGSAIITLLNPVEAYSQSRTAAERNREVLFVGRLEDTKGADLAAAAAALAGAELTIVCEGPLAPHIRELHPRARLVGRCGPEEIQRFARQARMLVMPSRYPEPFGLVAMEAAWSGLPVILAQTALLSDELVASGAGLAVDPRGTPGFAAAMRLILDDDAIACAMSQAAFTAIRTLALDPGTWIERLEAVLAGRIETAKPVYANAVPGRMQTRPVAFASEGVC
jgi:glycosyltransferase involved in cell wall biosynthesis